MPSKRITCLLNRLYVEPDDSINASDSVLFESSITVQENSNNSTKSFTDKLNSYHEKTFAESDDSSSTKDRASIEIDNYERFNTKGELLKSLEIDLNCIKASTVDLERVFIQSKLILTNLRTILSDETINDLMF